MSDEAPPRPYFFFGGGERGLPYIMNSNFHRDILNQKMSHILSQNPQNETKKGNENEITTNNNRMDNETGYKSKNSDDHFSFSSSILIPKHILNPISFFILFAEGK